MNHTIGIIGAGVMGGALSANFASHGYAVSVYDLDREHVRALREKYPQAEIDGFVDLDAFLESLESPKKVLLMVPAGRAVDEVLSTLAEKLQPGDLILDAGNSFYEDTQRRQKMLDALGIGFLGLGVSGGEQGALHGPALMPGGDRSQYDKVAPLLEAISAKSKFGACCTYIGPGGAGHFVKMVHNAIEYAEMQLIAEAYDLLKRLTGLSDEALGEVFCKWNTGELKSYLIEITADILNHKDLQTGRPILEIIDDAAGQKGTGSWAACEALKLGVFAPNLAQAVFARDISAQKQRRQNLSECYGVRKNYADLTDQAQFIEEVRRSLYFGKLCAWLQGLELISQASERFGWEIDLKEVILVFTGGCIIRCAAIERIADALLRSGDGDLLADAYFVELFKRYHKSVRKVACAALASEIPVGGLLAALSYYDSSRAPHLPVNLIQAQRDYFGAHTFSRIDQPGSYHIDWISKEEQEK